MPTEKTYTLEQIKAAFWKQFHKSGEAWFDNYNYEEECTHATDGYWRDFQEKLEAQE